MGIQKLRIQLQLRLGVGTLEATEGKFQQEFS